MRSLDTFFLAETVLHGFVDRTAKSHQKFVARLPTDFFENHETEPTSIFE